jgi:hypothetical protein
MHHQMAAVVAPMVQGDGALACVKLRVPLQGRWLNSSAEYQQCHCKPSRNNRKHSKITELSER